MTPELKVGMRVRRTTGPNHDMKVGETGTVVWMSPDSKYANVMKDGGAVASEHSTDYLEPLPPTFELGDRVEWQGAVGVVKGLHDNAKYPVEVIFEKDDHIDFFLTDGREHTFHTKTSLVLVEKWKPMKVECEFTNERDGIYSTTVNVPKEIQKKKFRVTFEEIR